MARRNLDGAHEVGRRQKTEREAIRGRKPPLKPRKATNRVTYETDTDWVAPADTKR